MFYAALQATSFVARVVTVLILTRLFLQNLDRQFLSKGEGHGRRGAVLAFRLDDHGRRRPDDKLTCWQGDKPRPFREHR